MRAKDEECGQKDMMEAAGVGESVVHPPHRPPGSVRGTERPEPGSSGTSDPHLGAAWSKWDWGVAVSAFMPGKWAFICAVL